MKEFCAGICDILHYKFHFIGSLKGMLLGLSVCLLVGVLVQIVEILFR